MAAVNVELVFFRIFVRLTHGIRGTCSPSTRFVIRAALLLYTLAMVAVLSYLHFAFVSEPSALAGLIARAASEAERGGGFHILEVTMTEASSGVAFELPNGTRTTTTTFVVSAATGLTSFVFNETQRRMVRFTLALGHAVQRRRPVLRLVIAHSVESLVFVPIMIGLLFFMFEFFGDKLLAFLVFMALWACEVFAVVACRTVQSVRVFPVTALLCLTWLMVYVLVFPFGLHHLALACVFSALTCSAYHQWTSFELPALEHGRLSEATPRETIVVSPAQGLTADLIRNLQRGPWASLGAGTKARPAHPGQVCPGLLLRACMPSRNRLPLPWTGKPLSIPTKLPKPRPT
ncbi:hypothetical protein FNF28_02185 [Cafeteria roenbergensis]|uniref:Uncharacterized protein n=1 Tax=Cafeteria roenbergensis TaxID=33653 RepID=A0A5A8DZX6_CAFRO|nr:hypothetical protein FNF28_02185 [Cafeteria roenbergensis]